MKQNIRNIAIIAHVDHGKTTLVDKMLLAGNLFRENQQTGELMLDNNERSVSVASRFYPRTSASIIKEQRSISSTLRITPTSAARWSAC